MSVATYLHLTNIKKEKVHHINFGILILAMIVTILYVFILSIIRMINANMLNGIFVMIISALFVIIFGNIIYKYPSNSYNAPSITNVNIP